jgi:uncharacterized protein (TIGR02444 family)
VCLLLFALWAGARCGHRLTEAEIARLREAGSPWHREVVKALRAVRKRLKTGPAPSPSPATDALRAKVQAAEIEAERIELEALAETLPLIPATSLDAGAALANLSRLCPPEGTEDAEALERLVAAAAT